LTQSRNEESLTQLPQKSIIELKMQPISWKEGRKMWKQKIGISIDNTYNNISEVLQTLKQIGFDAVSPGYTDNESLSETIRAARECGLFIQSLHAPFGKAAGMWSRDETVFGPALEEQKKALTVCAKEKIPVMVVHTWIGFTYTFDASDLHFDNFDILVAEAEKHGIKIAFENTEGEEYLFALMEHYKNCSTVGFCWDSGHEMCYNHSEDLLARFGDRLIMTHLNDNLGLRDPGGVPSGNDDLHFLPYDGNICWEKAIARLQTLPRQTVLNFELKKRAVSTAPGDLIYHNLSTEEYFRLAGLHARRIADLYDRQMTAAKEGICT